MSRKTAARIALPVYLLSIYATLGVMRTVTNFLRERDVLRLSVAAVFTLAAIAVCVVVFRSKALRSLRVAGVLVVCAAAYAAIIWPMESPEEKLHFVEYGLVALLAYEAAPESWTGIRHFVAAALFVVAAGWLDEGIQGLIPSRHYDLRDVAFNATAGLLALTTLTLVTWAGRSTAARR